MNNIIKKTDSYTIKSSDILKQIIEQKIKKTYVAALRCIEIRFGDSFDGYENIRKEILRTGNNAIREIFDKLNSSFNIEMIPEVVTINFVNPEKDFVKEGTNEGSEII